MATVKDFRELRVYQAAFAAAVNIQELTKHFPKDEKYSLIDQVRRSARSVNANLAEAWRKRRYPNHFVSKLSDADAEAAETLVWLDFALAFGYLNEPAYKELTKQYDQICAQLTVMMNQPEQWTPK